MNPENLKRFKPIRKRCACSFPAAKRRAKGDIFPNPEIARAFRLVADKGPDAFYKGEIAAGHLKTSQHLGGTMTAEDLAAFSSEWVQPDFHRLPRLARL